MIKFPSPILSASSTASANRARSADGRLLVAPAAHQPIDDHFDIVPHLPVEPQIVGQLHHAAIDASPDETLLQQVLEQVAIFPLLARISGASTRNGVPGGNSAIRSIICSRVWAVIGRAHLGQCPKPTRANSTRK